jgi:hypothetical protein
MIFHHCRVRDASRCWKKRYDGNRVGPKVPLADKKAESFAGHFWGISDPIQADISHAGCNERA